MANKMSGKKLATIIVSGVVVVLIAVLVTDAALFQGNLFVNRLTGVKQFDVYKWHNLPASIVVSAVPTVVPSEVPSTVTSEVPSVVVSTVPSTVTSDVPSTVTSDVPSATSTAVASGVPMPDKYGPKYDLSKLKQLTYDHLKQAAKEYYKKNKPKFNLSTAEKTRLLDAYNKAKLQLKKTTTGI